MPQNQEIEIRSEEVQDIIGASPNWLLRSGMTLLFAVVVVLLLVSYFFRYPDVVNAPVFLVSENPPNHLVARVDGRVEKILVADGDKVEVGQILMVLENAGKYSHFTLLKSKLEELATFVNNFDVLPKLTDSLVLGDVQNVYYELNRAIVDYENFWSLEYYPREISALKEQVRMEKIYYNRLWARRGVLMQELELADKRYRRDSLLYKKSVLSELSWSEAKEAWLQKKLKFNDIRTLLAKTKKEMLVLEQKEVAMEKEYQDVVSKKRSMLIDIHGRLLGAIAEWERMYLLKAEIEGQVVFNDVWANNQQLRKGDVVCSVLPFHKKEVIGKIELPMLKAGKVQKGQRINIRLKNYPYMEYGVLVGEVSNIAEVSNNSQYVVTVKLPQNLKTSYNIQLRFFQEMEGNAEIVTENLRLIQRVVNPLRSLVKNRVE